MQSHCEIKAAGIRDPWSAPILKNHGKAEQLEVENCCCVHHFKGIKVLLLNCSSI